MRLKLTLAVDRRFNILPINYPYCISSWIYDTIQSGDSGFSHWLHEQGYSYENKRFKLFTFSKLFIQPKWKQEGDRLKIFSGKAALQLSFYVDEAVENFIIGLFQNQRFKLGDRKSEAKFEVVTVERLPDPSFGTEALLDCRSPLCLSRSNEERGQPEYLAPDYPDYQRYFFDNLLYKYLAAARRSPPVNGAGEGAIDSLREQAAAQQPLTIEVLSEPKSSLIKIKADTPQETSVRGYSYRFKMTAPTELITLGYHAGFGEKNSLGFGCVDLAIL